MRIREIERPFCGTLRVRSGMSHTFCMKRAARTIVKLGRGPVLGQERTFDTSAKIVKNRVKSTEEIRFSATIL